MPFAFLPFPFFFRQVSNARRQMYLRSIQIRWNILDTRFSWVKKNCRAQNWRHKTRRDRDCNKRLSGIRWYIISRNIFSPLWIALTICSELQKSATHCRFIARCFATFTSDVYQLFSTHRACNSEMLLIGGLCSSYGVSISLGAFCYIRAATRWFWMGHPENLGN